MPPTSSMRKTSVATNDGTNRRQSGRQARTTTNRPINYYARNFGSMSGAVEEPPDDSPPGFFPAIQFFADSISALPREVQRHVTLMKEVEAKVYGPTEALKQLSQKILSLPDPPRRNQRPLHGLGLLSFTANNSVPSSVTGSVINGSAPNLGQRVSDSGQDVPAAAPRGRQAKTATPRTDTFPTDTGMLRTRSNRGTNNRGGDHSTASEPASTKTARKNGHRKSGSDLEVEDDDDEDDEGEEEQDTRSRRSQQTRVTAVSRSRRGNGNDSRSAMSTSRVRSVADEEPALEPDVGDDEEEAEDPNEDKYCYCGQGSFGEMIACDNDDCPREWFHLDCTGLRAIPGDNVKWYCDDCKEAMQATSKRKGRPASRHAG